MELGVREGPHLQQDSGGAARPPGFSWVPVNVAFMGFSSGLLLGDCIWPT